MVLSLFVARLVQLQGIDPQQYAQMAAAEGSVSVVLPAERGDILDRNGQPLAGSADGLMIVADPAVTSEQAPQLATLLTKQLGLDYFGTLSRLRARDSRFQYLARQIPAQPGPRRRQARRRPRLQGPGHPAGPGALLPRG